MVSAPHGGRTGVVCIVASFFVSPCQCENKGARKRLAKRPREEVHKKKRHVKNEKGPIACRLQKGTAPYALTRPFPSRAKSIASGGGLTERTSFLACPDSKQDQKKRVAIIGAGKRSSEKNLFPPPFYICTFPLLDDNTREENPSQIHWCLGNPQRTAEKDKKSVYQKEGIAVMIFCQTWANRLSFGGAS
nr:hypothetical protein [Pandoravirus massiliensis]